MIPKTGLKRYPFWKLVYWNYNCRGNFLLGAKKNEDILTSEEVTETAMEKFGGRYLGENLI